MTPNATTPGALAPGAIPLRAPVHLDLPLGFKNLGADGVQQVQDCGFKGFGLTPCSLKPFREV